MLLEQMISFEMFITFNANKIHQGIRHFYELLNIGVHNMSYLSICMVFFSMSNQQTPMDLVHPTETGCYQSVFFCSEVCILPLKRLCRLNCRSNKMVFTKSVTNQCISSFHLNKNRGGVN